MELDSIYHQPGWTPLSDDEFRARVAAATEPETWVVDGNYSVIRDITWSRADTVVWFDLPYRDGDGADDPTNRAPRHHT